MCLSTSGREDTGGTRPPQGDRARPVFIGGAGRSGTTILRVMLNAHPRLVSGPEFKVMSDVANFYTRMRRETEVLCAYGLDQGGALEAAFAGFVASLFDPFVTSKPGSRVVEKTPNNLLVMNELAAIFPAATFIHVVRDGRDVANSLVGMNWLTLDGQPLWYTQNLEAAFQYWAGVVTKGLMDASHPSLMGRVLLVRYEDLVTKPESEMRRVLDFIGESWDPAVLEYYKVDRGPEPEESSTAQVAKPLYGDAIGRWRATATKADKRIFKRLGGDLLVRLGYESHMGW